MTNLLWLTIRVLDLEEALAFYQDLLGFRLERRFSPSEGVEIAFLKGEGPTQIELLQMKGAPVTESSNVSIGITVPDPEVIFQKVLDRNLTLSDPMALGPGTECRFVRGPNCVEVQIVYEI